MCYPLAVKQCVPTHGVEYVIWKTKDTNIKLVAVASTIGAARWQSVSGHFSCEMHPTDLYVPTKDVFESILDHVTNQGAGDEDTLDLCDPYDPTDFGDG